MGAGLPPLLATALAISNIAFDDEPTNLLNCPKRPHINDKITRRFEIAVCSD